MGLLVGWILYELCVYKGHMMVGYCMLVISIDEDGKPDEGGSYRQTSLLSSC